jgi:hypothetical protein
MNDTMMFLGWEWWMEEERGCGFNLFDVFYVRESVLFYVYVFLNLIHFLAQIERERCSYKGEYMLLLLNFLLFFN